MEILFSQIMTYIMKCGSGKIHHKNLLLQKITEFRKYNDRQLNIKIFKILMQFFITDLAIKYFDIFEIEKNSDYDQETIIHYSLSTKIITDELIKRKIITLGCDYAYIVLFLNENISYFEKLGFRYFETEHFLSQICNHGNFELIKFYLAQFHFSDELRKKLPYNYLFTNKNLTKELLAVIELFIQNKFDNFDTIFDNAIIAHKMEIINLLIKKYNFYSITKLSDKNLISRSLQCKNILFINTILDKIRLNMEINYLERCINMVSDDYENVEICLSITRIILDNGAYIYIDEPTINNRVNNIKNSFRKEKIENMFEEYRNYGQDVKVAQ